MRKGATLHISSVDKNMHTNVEINTYDRNNKSRTQSQSWSKYKPKKVHYETRSNSKTSTLPLH